MADADFVDAVDTVDTDTDTRRARRLRLTRGVRLAAFVTIVVLGAGLAFAIPILADPTEEDLREQAGLIGKTELLIGVKDDVPGVAYRDPETGRYSGFDIDIAYLVAADLGFADHEVRFLHVEDEDRARMSAWDPVSNKNRLVDLVIATYSANAQREQEGATFSAPYLETEQSVMTRSDHREVHVLTDLDGEKVCTLSTSTSKTQVDGTTAEVRPVGSLRECVDRLRSGEFDAVTSDAPLLAGFVAEEPETFVHHDIGLSAEERWAVNTGGNEPLRTLVNLILYRSLNDESDRRWEEAYDRNLRPLEQDSLPQPLVRDRQQPDVPEVEVRQWPWE